MIERVLSQGAREENGYKCSTRRYRVVSIFGSILLVLTGLPLATKPLAAQNPSEPLLPRHARVRVIVDSAQINGPFLVSTPLLGRIVLAGGCIAFSPDSITGGPGGLARSPLATSRIPVVIRIADLSTIEISSLYDGRVLRGESNRIYTDGDEVDNEEWIPVQIEAALSDPRICSGPD